MRETAERYFVAFPMFHAFLVNFTSLVELIDLLIMLVGLRMELLLLGIYCLNLRFDSSYYVDSVSA